MHNKYDEVYVEAHLFDAGKAVSRLPAKGTRPSIYTGSLPDVVLDPQEAYGYGEPSLPRQSNNPRQMTHMDICVSWVHSLPATYVRRVILMRMIINPINEKHSFSWKQIARHMDCNDKTAKAWYDSGLRQIAGKLSNGDLMPV